MLLLPWAYFFHTPLSRPPPSPIPRYLPPLLMQHVNVSLAAGGGLDLLQAAFIRDVLWVGPAVASPPTAAAASAGLVVAAEGSSPPPLIDIAVAEAATAVTDEDMDAYDDDDAAAAAAVVAAAADAEGRPPTTSEGSPSSVFLDFAGVQGAFSLGGTDSALYLQRLTLTGLLYASEADTNSGFGTYKTALPMWAVQFTRCGTHVGGTVLQVGGYRSPSESGLPCPALPSCTRHHRQG